MKTLYLSPIEILVLLIQLMLELGLLVILLLAFIVFCYLMASILADDWKE